MEQWARGFNYVAEKCVCADCVDDEPLRDYIRERAEERTCSYCGREADEPIACELDVKEELPSPRTVEVAPADIVFQDGLDIELGGVTVRVRHVGGNHSAESSVMYVEPDRVPFLGDGLSDSPEGVLTAELALPLHDAILRFDAELYVEGHHESVSSRAEIESLIEKMAIGREGRP